VEIKMETVYNVGDEVKINNVLWKVGGIRHRFGKLLSYDMKRNDGKKGSFSIETGSLETLMGVNNDSKAGGFWVGHNGEEK
jgi:hypothetical protein